MVKNKIVEILNNKKNITISNIQSYPISLSLRRQYHQKNILILGEGLHTIHPVAGQGFNLVLRDIKKLQEIVKYYVGLGISIKNSFALNDFYNSRKPENTIMSLGVDATHSFFKQNKYLDPFKEIIVKNIKNNETIKKFSKIISLIEVYHYNSMNIYALSSGRGPSGIAIVRISGNETLKICQKFDQVKRYKSNEVNFCKFYDPKNDNVIDPRLYYCGFPGQIAILEKI